jgi:hypothetical protein
MKKTLIELIKEGVTKFRCDPWNEFAYITLTIVTLKDGTKAYGPWAQLYDIPQYRGEEPPITVPAWGGGFESDSPIWEAWVDPGPMPAQKGEADDQAKAAL